jgi:hypothetical protein
LPQSVKQRSNRRKTTRAGGVRKSRHRLRKVLFYLCFPFFVWFVAFLAWFYWHDLSRLFYKDEGKPKPAAKFDARQNKGDNREAAPATRPEEKILDEDRRKLEDILKQRQ